MSRRTHMQRGHSYRLRMFQFTRGATALNLIRLEMIYGFTYCMILQEFQRTNLTTCRSCPRCAHGLGQQFVPVLLGSPHTGQPQQQQRELSSSADI